MERSRRRPLEPVIDALLDAQLWAIVATLALLGVPGAAGLLGLGVLAVVVLAVPLLIFLFIRFLPAIIIEVGKFAGELVVKLAVLLAMVWVVVGAAYVVVLAFSPR